MPIPAELTAAVLRPVMAAMLRCGITGVVDAGSSGLDGLVAAAAEPGIRAAIGPSLADSWHDTSGVLERRADTDDDITAFAAGGVTVNYNPLGNAMLGFGVASGNALARLQAAGVPIVLGSDYAPSMIATPFDMLRAALVVQRELAANDAASREPATRCARPQGVTTTPRLVVLADDRTGADETAGACAEFGCGSVPVLGWSSIEMVSSLRNPVIVLDLGSRHLDPASAVGRVNSVARSTVEAIGGGVRLAHKIDSTLRGNWASEIVASQRRNGAPVIVVPAFPAAGRTCRNGVVFDGAVPVAEGPAGADARQPVRSSEPSEHLTAAGAEGVVSIRSADELRSWAVGTTGGVAVCDATTDSDISLLAAVWAEHPTAVFAGTAASVSAAAGRLVGRHHRNAEPRPSLPLDGPVLVVCASLHPAARRQLDVLAARTANLPARPVDCIVTPVPTTAGVSADAAHREAVLLAEAVRRAMAQRRYATIIVLGGDTAAALLGNEPMVVHGILAPGAAWGHLHDAVLVTRPGGFGDDTALADLVVAHDGTVRATASGQ